MRGWFAAFLIVLVGTSLGQSKHPNPKPDSLEAQLYLAVQYGNEKDVTNLLAKGAKVNTWNEGVPNPLFNLSGTKELVETIGKALIDAGADRHARNELGNTLLTCWQVRGSDSNTSLEYFLTLGLDPNEIDGEGVLPLEAAIWNRMKHIEPLIRAGANPRLKDKQGITPLEHFYKQFARNIEWRNQFPFAATRQQACEEYLEEMNGYLRVMDKQAGPLINPGPKLVKDGISIEMIVLGALEIERSIGFTNDRAIVTMSIKNSGEDQTLTIEDLTLQSQPTTARLPVQIALRKGEVKVQRFEFRVANHQDYDMDIIYSTTIPSDRTLYNFGDHGYSIPNPSRSGSTPAGSDVEEVAMIGLTADSAVRIVEVKVDGKVKPDFAGYEMLFRPREFKQTIPGLLVPMNGKKSEITYDFRFGRNGKWHRTTVVL